MGKDEGWKYSGQRRRQAVPIGIAAPRREDAARVGGGGAPGRGEGLGLPAGDRCTGHGTPAAFCPRPPSPALTPPQRTGCCLPPFRTPPPPPAAAAQPPPSIGAGRAGRTSPSCSHCGAPGPAVVPRLRVRCRRAAAPPAWEARLADVGAEVMCALPKIRANYY